MHARCRIHSRANPYLILRRPLHLFANINQFWVKPLQEYISSVENKKNTNVLEVLTPVIKAGKAMKKCGWCRIHQQNCWLEETEMHTAGTPCRDDSSQGQQDGLDGKQTSFLLAFIALRMMLQERVVLQDRSTHISISDFVISCHP